MTHHFAIDPLARSASDAVASERIIILMFVVQLPFVLQHFSKLWRFRPHYEFFPFVLGAGGWLLWQRCWRCVSCNVASLPDEAGNPGTYVEGELAGPTGESGLLLFCLFDGAGRLVHPVQTSWSRKLSTNTLVAKVKGRDVVTTSQTTLRVQQFMVSDFALPEAERRQLRQLFATFREVVHDRWINSNRVQ